MDDLQSQRAEITAKFDAEHQAWDDWYRDADYDSLGFQWRQASGVALCHAHVTDGGVIIDAGCGAGHASVELARLGYHAVALDIAPSMVEAAKKNAADAGVAERCTFVVGDLTTAELDPVDGILGLGFIEYFDDPDAIFALCRDLLAPGGVVVMQVWNRRPVAEVLSGWRSRMGRALRHPITWAREKAWALRHRRGRKTAVISGDVDHRRYTPGEVLDMVRGAGLEPVGERGTRWFSHGSRLSESTRLRWERRLQRLTQRFPWLSRLAVDWVVAARRP